MAIEIKRKAELTLATLLSEALPDFKFYVAKGGTDTGGVTIPIPPFGAVWIDDAEKTVSYEKIYFLRGSVVWITRAGKGGPGESTTDVAVHSDAVQKIYNAMLEVGKGVDVDRKLIVHGVDVATVNEFSDTDRLAHGDVIAFTMGVTEFD